jgi:hypothetical protein
MFVYTFIRNPWDRILSAFCFLQQLSTYGKIDNKWRFGEYVEEVLAKNGHEVNEHFAPQAPTFLYKGKPIPGVFVGRFETLREDWAYIAGRINEERHLPHLGSTKHPPYVDCYTRRTEDIVYAIYQEEIEAAGYEFGK